MLQDPLPQEAGKVAQSDFLYCQQWQVLHSLNQLGQDSRSMQARAFIPKLSFQCIAGQVYQHRVPGQGGAAALRGLAALQKAVTDKSVSQVVSDKGRPCDNEIRRVL